VCISASVCVCVSSCLIMAFQSNPECYFGGKYANEAIHFNFRNNFKSLGSDFYPEEHMKLKIKLQQI